MKCMKMPTKRIEYEWKLLWAYQAGMNDGYGIEHQDITNEERKAEERFIKEHSFKHSRDEILAYVKELGK